LSRIEKSWKQVYPAAVFNYRFYDESLALLYEKDLRTANLINASMAITIFISCIGLFGLVVFMAEKRSKEISIRKIMGARVGSIVALLNKDFILLIIIAFFIASPVAYYFANQWLQGFAYRISISWWMFALAVAFALTMALLTVSFQSIKTANINLVKNLRVE
jgi:ABC-type antimicrobial peptide transport system permease subunit